mgnify:CR=1 FL=1
MGADLVDEGVQALVGRGAVLAQRAPTTLYSATEDTFVLAIAADDMRTLATQSPVFGDFLNRRILKFLDLSRAALQVAYSSQALAEQSLETTLGALPRRAPVCVAPARSAMVQANRTQRS